MSLASGLCNEDGFFFFPLQKNKQPLSKSLGRPLFGMLGDVLFFLLSASEEEIQYFFE